jgi:hypothetical protein
VDVFALVLLELDVFELVLLEPVLIVIHPDTAKTQQITKTNIPI